MDERDILEQIGLTDAVEGVQLATLFSTLRRGRGGCVSRKVIQVSMMTHTSVYDFLKMTISEFYHVTMALVRVMQKRNGAE